MAPGIMGAPPDGRNLRECHQIVDALDKAF